MDILKRKEKVIKNSKVKILSELADSHQDWGLDEIRDRNIRISYEFIKTIKEWKLNDSEFLYKEKDKADPELIFTPEEEALLEKLKEKGLVNL